MSFLSLVFVLQNDFLIIALKYLISFKPYSTGIPYQIWTSNPLKLNPVLWDKVQTFPYSFLLEDRYTNSKLLLVLISIFSVYVSKNSYFTLFNLFLVNMKNFLLKVL